MWEFLDNITNYLATGGVALCLGWLTYRNTRAGQRDTARLQDRANRISETQQALDAQKSISEQWRLAFIDEREQHLLTKQELKETREFVRKDFEDAVKQMDIKVKKKS